MSGSKMVKVRLLPDRYYTVDDRLHGPDEVVEVPAAEAETMVEAGFALSPEHTDATVEVREQLAAEALAKSTAGEPVYPPDRAGHRADIAD